MSKRKRGNGRLPKWKAPRKRAARGRRFVPGRDRTGGFYGRFSGSLAEQKFLDTNVIDATLAANMVHFNLCVIPQDNTESGRIGRKVTIKSIAFHGVLTLDAAVTSANTSNNIRMMLVQDKQTNGAEFAATDLLDTNAILSFNNLANSGRFRILHSDWIDLNTDGGVELGVLPSWGTKSIWVNFYKKCNIPIEYDNTAVDGSIGTVRTNSLWMIFQTIDAERVGVSGIARVRYTDK